MQKWVVICWAALAVVGADVCPDGGLCKEGETCCNSPANGYGCCRYENAECCDDHIHCCPEGTVCNKALSGCINTTLTIPWVKRTPADQPKVSKSFRMIKTYESQEDDNICPDLSRCPAEYSCLKGLTKFGCCPLTQGISCPDGKHCCPEGHDCSSDSRGCIKKELVVTVLCSDGISECPDGTTCCETNDGKWACCPLSKAVCCADKIHCCSEGTTCDVEHSKCIDSSTKKEMPMWAKLPARVRAAWENQKEVPVEAVNNTGTENAPKVTTANLLPPSANDVPCDDTSACPDGTTCCKTQEGGWACCPMPEAVCCEDFIHCCPKGKKCNLKAQTCEDGLISVPWAKKVPAIIKQKVEVKDVPCDDTSACPDGTTCCKTQEGGWACCPMPEAVCCEDFIHCCPKGKKCNLKAQTCEDGLISVPWAKKLPAIIKQKVEVKDVPCDDTSACPDGTTCCKTQEGGWACCPMPEAVCCEDFIHCCPKGKKCNLEAQTCEGGVISVPWAKKVPAIIKQKAEEKKVPCDHTAACPDGTTCCKTQEGRWACCPLPEAVCCDDHKHCCPSGTTCDPTAVSCNGPSGSTPMLQKVPAFTTEAPTTVQPTTESPTTSAKSEEEDKEEEGMINCDAHTSCPQSTTCCYMKNFKKWGCCPLPEAVCCEDGSHCCPNQYKCDNSRTSCIKGEVVIPWYTKIPAITSDEAEPYSVQCEGASQCPEQTSCCKLFTGEWGCCPLKNAVCCPDKEHCCPQGYTCDILSRSCQKLIMMQLERVPLTPVYLLEPQPQLSPTKHKDIKCDKQTNCGHDETCCRTSATSWGCCPSSNAVCCSNMKHCCPTGYTCTEENSCIQNSKLYWPNWHVFVANKKRALIV
uniref:Granulins domain-containing protein n=1 Tax=Astatotilapia calliptera TaxID=8154 RepID=A0AAX7TEY6_ASTCA